MSNCSNPFIFGLVLLIYQDIELLTMARKPYERILQISLSNPSLLLSWIVTHLHPMVYFVQVDCKCWSVLVAGGKGDVVVYDTRER